MLRKIAAKCLKVRELELKKVLAKLKSSKMKERCWALMRLQPLKNEIVELRKRLDE